MQQPVSSNRSIVGSGVFYVVYSQATSLNRPSSVQLEKPGLTEDLHVYVVHKEEFSIT
jgi:redox-regulated HSP33 family molecular chaperone